MKKVFLAMMFAAMTAVSVQAQFFAGGTLGVDFKADKATLGTSTDKGPAQSSFKFSPMGGYYLSDKLGVGVMIDLGMSSWNNRAEDPTKDRSVEWGFGPFLRYTLLTHGKFSLLAQGGVGIFGSTSKRISGTTTDTGPSVFGFDISVMPLLSYNLSNRVSLEASTNLARFGFTTQTEKRGSGDALQKSTESSFGFGVDSTDFFKCPFQIGVIIKF